MPETLRYLGVSGFEITTEDGTTIVVDPFLAGSADLGLPPSPIAAGDLRDAHLVLVTHGAYDHLGQAVEIATRTGATLVCGPEVRIHALREGLPGAQIAKMVSGSSLEVRGVRIRALEAHHVSFFESQGAYLSAQPLSYLIETPTGARLYHSGDTSLFSDLKLFGELYRPQVALLCVGAVEEGVAALPPEEAAIAADWLNAPLVIPMHYRDSSEVEAFQSRLAARRPDIRVVRLEPGHVFQLSQT
ncbi:MAG TPA: MBL fold metallo-hydrolase [bacterium]|nr:MBL fold metallo-hydrolase [bacterium]